MVISIHKDRQLVTDYTTATAPATTERQVITSTTPASSLPPVINPTQQINQPTAGNELSRKRRGGPKN